MTENIKPEVLKTLKAQSLGEIMKGTKHNHSFSVDYSRIDPNFVGDFTVRRPSLIEQMQIGVVRSQLLGGVPVVDTLTDNIATMVSTLETVVQSSPEWFNVFDANLDYEILEGVYMQYIEWYNSFRKSSGESKPTGDSTNERSEDVLEDNEGVQSTSN